MGPGQRVQEVSKETGANRSGNESLQGEVPVARDEETKGKGVKDKE